jgi:hypothetical protein
MINPFSMTPENLQIWQAQHANQNAKWQGDIMGLTGSARTGQGFGPANYRRAGTGIKIVHRSSRGAGLGLGNTFATNPFVAL